MSALLLQLIGGSASAQLVKVLNSQNGVWGLTANVGTQTFDLNDSTTVFVVGLYGDGGPDAAGFNAVTFGGVPPTGFMNISGAGQTRSALAYWINPNTTAGQVLQFNYTTTFAGYFWTYELSNVDLNSPVVTSGPTMTFASSTSVTTLTNNSFVISYFSGNNNVAASVNALTPNPPLIQNGVTIVNAPAGASMASATYTASSPGLVNISWNVNPSLSLGNRGVAGIAFQPLNVGAPIVGGSVSPSVSAPGSDFVLTVTIDPFHYGNVTNVSVDLSSIGGSSANALVQSSDPNVWTNSFVVPGGAPLGTTALAVTAKQDASPVTGTGTVAINLATPSAPVLVKDTIPTALLNMYVGQGVTFSAGFSAPGFISYHWQKSGDGFTYTNIPGATGNTYTIPSVALSDGGYYQLQASNVFGAAVSTPALISILSPTASSYIWSAPVPFGGLTAEKILTNFPANNKIAGAMLAKNGGSPVSVILTNAGNQPIVFAPANAWASLSGGTNYILNLSTNKTGNSTFDSVLNGGYSDGATHTITLGGLVMGQQYEVQLFALDDRPGLTPDGSLQFANFGDPFDPYALTSESFAMADNVYFLGKFTASSTEMMVQQNLLSSVGNFNCLVLRTVGWDPPPYFTVQPKDTNNFAGTAVSFTATAAADTTIANPTITYQWAKGSIGGPYNDLSNDSKYAGVTSTTLIISNLVSSDAASVYVLKATDSGGTATSREAHIYVQSQPPAPPANSFAAAVLALTNNPGSRLIGLWQLNEVEDPSIGILMAQDASGNGRNGTYGVTSQNKFNNVLSPQPPTYGGFSSGQGALRTGAAGTSDASSVVNLPPLNITNGVDTTICMWINPSDIAGSLSGLLYNRGPDQCGFGFAGNTGGPSGQRNLGFVWNNANGEATFNYNSGLFPVNDVWNFVVLVIRTNAATFYLDYVDTNGAAFFGKAADTAARYTQNFWSGGPIWIGGDSINSGNGLIFPGRISNVAVFNSALTDDQIYNLFVAGFQTAGFPASLVQQPPAYSTNYVGYTLQISTQPGGSKPITNQWRFNGTNLVDGWYNGSIVSGSTSNVLTIANVSTAWQGVFNLAVTNFLGGAVSDDANVTVLTPVAPPSGNLVGKWFDGTDSLADHSGHSPGTHDAYGVGATATNYRFTNSVPPGKTGDSLNLYGGTSMGISNSTINDPGYVNTFDDGIATAFSVMTWAKGQPAAWNPFVSKNGETEGWQLRRSAGANSVFTLRGTGGTVDPAGAAGGSGADGAWHHYAGTYDSVTGTRTLYVDGVVQNVTTGDGPYLLSPGSRLVLGGRSNPPDAAIDGAANFTGGMLYDTRIYNTALSDVQIAYLAVPPLLVPPQNLSSTVIPASGGNPGQLVLSWLNGGLLLQATNVIGPWVTNQTATPPYTVPMTNSPAEYYRVLFP